MTLERWQQVKQVAADAAVLPREERAAWLDLHCADDPALRGEVDSLRRRVPAGAGAFRNRVSRLGLALRVIQ